MTNKVYTGVGSRRAPLDVQQLLSRRAQELAIQGYTLRSGAAPGADTAFEWGAIAGKGKTEIWLPWRGFDGHKSPLVPSDEAFHMAAQFHPAWNRCSEAAKKFHARNCHQVMGADLKTPSDFVLYWTKSGKAEGGTGQALRIARHFGIPTEWVTVSDSAGKVNESPPSRGTQLWQTKVLEFAQLITHGDADHQKWLLESANNFIHGLPVKRP